jgi:hypothetical protein
MRKFIRPLFFGLVALLWGVPLLVATDGGEAAAVLEESYQASRDLPAQDRAFFLVRLADISTGISPARTESFCQELLDLAPTLPRDWNRVATEKNGLVPLARVNPIRAFELLSKVEKPVPNEGIFTEDVRADAAAVIFVKYFQAVGPDGLGNILKTAEIIGGPGGEYPYRAMGSIILELAKTHASDKVINDVFGRAVSHYTRISEFQDEDEQFFELLVSTRPVVKDHVYREGLVQFVHRVSAQASKEPADYKAEVTTDKGVFTFDSQKKVLLFRMFPIISKLSGKMAQDLIRQYPWLSNADAEVRSVVASAINGGKSEDIAVTMQALDQSVIARRVRYLQDSDPITAIANARSLKNDLERAVAFAAVIPSLTQFDQASANKTYADLQALVENLPAGTPKLRGFVSLAKAAYHLSHPSEFSQYTTQSFDYGTRLFASDLAKNTDVVTLRHPGSTDLIDLAEFGGQHMGTAILGRIRGIQERGLRAYLLLFAAKGIGQAENASAVFAAR